MFTYSTMRLLASDMTAVCLNFHLEPYNTTIRKYLQYNENINTLALTLHRHSTSTLRRKTAPKQKVIYFSMSQTVQTK